MQSTHRAAFGFLGLSLSLVLAGGCGQNEGGRCQTDSDCASGLECSDPSGNGVCRKPGSAGPATSDAALTSDVAADLASTTGPELPPVGPEVGPEVVAIDGARADAAELDAAEIDADELDAAARDAAELDAGRPEAGELDVPMTEAGPVDVGAQG